MEEWVKLELEAKKVALDSPDSRVETLDEVFPDSQEELEKQDFQDLSEMKVNLALTVSKVSRVIAELTEHLDWMA